MRSYGRVSLSCAMVLAMAGSVFAQVEEAARQKLTEAQSAFKAAKSLSYHCEMRGTGGMMAMLPETITDVVMLRDDSGQILARVQGMRGEVAGIPALSFDVFYKGNIRSWIEDQTQTVYEKHVDQAKGDQIDSAATGTLRELFLPEPFAKDLTAPNIKLEQPVTLDGVPCDVVFVDPGAGLPKYRWSIGQGDKMPRKLDQIIQEMSMTQTWTLTNVRLNAPVTAAEVTIKVPEGYTFVPMTAPQQPQIPPPPPLTPGAKPNPAASAPKERTVGTSVDDLAPEFELADAEGKKVTLSSMRGNVVLLDFWGTWCLPCKKASPGLQQIHDTYKDQGVKVVGLAVRESNNDAPAKYMKDGNYTYGLLLKADEVAKQYRVRVFPTYYVIGKEGQIVHVATGYAESTIPDLTAAVEKALGKGKPAEPSAEEKAARAKEIAQEAAEAAGSSGSKR